MQENIKPNFDFLLDEQSSDDGICSSDCEICGGVGYVRYDVSRNHPEFGRAHYCPNANILKNPEQFGVFPEDTNLTWTDISFQESTNSDELKNAISVIKDTLERGYGWVYLWGGYGVAKTLLLKMAVVCYLKKNTNAYYTSMIEILDHLRNAYNTFNPSPDDGIGSRLEKWIEYSLLAIDEMDAMKETEFVNERRFYLLDKRYEMTTKQRKGVTIMASNESPDSLPGKLADRINDSRFNVVHISSTSIRPYMHVVDKNYARR